VARHNRAAETAIVLRDEESAVAQRELALDVASRVVPRSDEIAGQPQSDQPIPIARLVLTNDHRGSLSRHSRSHPRSRPGNLCAMEFQQYDETLAHALTASQDGGGGLAAFLGMRAVHSGPGELHVEIDARPDLMTPFGNMHGGVIAAMCD